MEKIIKEGKELELLLENICDEYSINKDELYYNVKNKKSGLFNKNNQVVVEAIKRSDLIEYIKSYLKELINNLGLEVSFEIKIRENVIVIKMYSNNNPILIGKNGNTLKSLEVLVKQRIQTDLGINCYIFLDVENYREKQELRLKRLAKKLAKEVYQTKIETHLEDMNAYDRRIIHNTLTDFKGVKTISEGEEPHRHIVIKPE